MYIFDLILIIELENEKPERGRNFGRPRFGGRRDHDRGDNRDRDRGRYRPRPARDPEEQERRERLRGSDKYKTAESLSSRFAAEKESSGSDGRGEEVTDGKRDKRAK